MSKNTSLFSKAIAKSEWPDKEELLDVVYWGRQILALLVGLVWGFLPLTGVLGIILYVAGLNILMHKEKKAIKATYLILAKQNLFIC